MYINSPGISTPDGRAMGFDTEAFAIADVMQYVHTTQTGARLAGSGRRGHRSITLWSVVGVGCGTEWLRD